MSVGALATDEIALLPQQPAPHTGQLWPARLRLSPAAARRAGGRLWVSWRGAVFWAYRVSDDVYEALLPTPLEAQSEPLWLEVYDTMGHVHLAVDVEDKVYPVSKLSVAPRFSVAPPPRVGREHAVIAAALQYSQPQRLFGEGFIKPCAGQSTSPFGVRRTFNGVTRTRHLGLDLQSPDGEPVWATNDGVVVLAAVDFFYTGNAVFLDHGEGLSTAVFHLSEILVRTGQKVHRGEILGRSGSTGRVTGPHVHFSVKLAGHYVDPVDLLDWTPEPFGLCEPGLDR